MTDAAQLAPLRAEAGALRSLAAVLRILVSGLGDCSAAWAVATAAARLTSEADLLALDEDEERRR